jgi:catechol-2,3-dioxygenase
MSARLVPLDAPALAGVHHLKLPSRDPRTGAAWYARVMGFLPAPALSEPGGVTLQHAETGMLVTLAHDPARAQAMAGCNVVAFELPDNHAMDAWIAHLEGENVLHSGLRRGKTGWGVAFHDMDGYEVRLHLREA